MKRLLALLPAMLLAAFVSAAPGDTTKVQSFAGLQMNHYGAFDTTVEFPDGSVSYRKILMNFTLGKYQCPGNPQYCGDWDYDVHMFIMTKTGDTLEIGRFITPYANASYARTPWTYKQRYVFDVTDFYNQLKDSATVRIFYSGYSWGFTADVRFDFIEGTPPRNVIDIDRAWATGSRFGDNSPSQYIENKVDTKTFPVPNGTQFSELLFMITGHGNDDNGCSEFCKKFYEVELNGNKFDKTDIWRDDCGFNHIYPQSGTWVYDRGNWCPGDIAFPNRHKLAGLTPGNNFNLDVDFEAYTGSVTLQNRSWGSYNIQSAVIHYGAFNKSLDASLEDIIAPSDHETHFRFNPFTGKPIVKVQNTGSTTITSIKFRYEVNTKGQKEYTWNGSLASLETADIELGLMTDLQSATGNTNTFNVEIVEVNGSADGDATNNKLTSNFKAAINLPVDLWVEMRTNSGIGGVGISQTSWKVVDLTTNNIVAQRNNCAPSTTYRDSFTLNPGMYKLEVEDAGCNGLYWWASPGDGRGELNLYRKVSVIPVPLTGYFNGDFGCGFTQYFNVMWPAAVTEVNTQPEIMVHPNPAAEQLYVSLSGLARANGTIRLVDMMGRVVLQQEVNSSTVVLNTSALSNGAYTVLYTTADGSNAKLQSRVVIAK
ncbi:MAG: T9SS type A sorting domain-containing protein [Taibaiella sp.]|nr:T9SS type A sorting domain-containing protein [Taibaiella sp.]